MAANSRPASQELHREILAEKDQGEDTDCNACVIKLEATLLSSSALVAASFLSRLQNLYVGLHSNPFLRTV